MDLEAIKLEEKEKRDKIKKIQELLNQEKVYNSPLLIECIDWYRKLEEGMYDKVWFS